MLDFILNLTDPQATLENVGGKGMSLARLSRAGLPVPNGFYVTTEAYRRFVSDNDLQLCILEALRVTDAAQPDSLDAASQRIADLFAAAQMPAEIAAAIRLAYTDLRNIPVAVRSSATAEDLPGASFAGQQETYLNIHGEAPVLEAVKRCWASLWTGRAIGYRITNHIDQNSVALAVVIQEMVPAKAAGVLFTANPTNGRRDEIVINAAWGLGEAVVSGAVTPDTITADRLTGRVLRSTVAAKQAMTVRTDAGTREQPVPRSLQRKAVLSRLQAEDLARLGGKIEDLYCVPMDIEWAFAEGRFAILQARPITSLPEAPLDWTSPHPKALLMRASFAEFVPGAVSPLFATLGVPMAEKAGQALMAEYMGQTGADSYPFAVVNGYVYIGIVFSARLIATMLITLLRGGIQRMLRTGPERWAAMSKKYHALVDRWQAEELSTLSPAELLTAANELYACSAECYSVAQASMIPTASGSELSFSRYYNALVKHKTDPDPSVFLLGFDSLPLRAEKSLFDLAKWTKTQPGLAGFVSATSSEDLCNGLRNGALPLGAPAAAWSELCFRFTAHLAEFGHTVYDLDFSKPLPVDDPAPLVETLKAYLEGKGSDPYARQQAAAEKREEATGAVMRHLDPLRRKWFLKTLRWAQEAAPRREDCIGELGLGYPVLRKVFAELGRRLVAGGALATSGDIYWLEASEIEALVASLEKGGPLSSLATQVEQRKVQWQRLHRAIVPLLLPVNSFWARIAKREHKAGNQLKGFGASSGQVTARACVLRDPRDFVQMQPGDVIVAVTTTPAWTPLFAIASAIVTEIGGPLSHSSIVAREYGIPAVLAVENATQRICSGQMITVDGSTGTITCQPVN